MTTMNPKKKWEKQWSRGNDRTHISNQQRQFRPESIPVTRTSSVSSLSSSPSPPDTGSPTPQESPQQVNSPSNFETRLVNRHKYTHYVHYIKVYDVPVTSYFVYPFHFSYNKFQLPLQANGLVPLNYSIEATIEKFMKQPNLTLRTSEKVPKEYDEINGDQDILHKFKPSNWWKVDRSSTITTNSSSISSSELDTQKGTETYNVQKQYPPFEVKSEQSKQNNISHLSRNKISSSYASSSFSSTSLTPSSSPGGNQKFYVYDVSGSNTHRSKMDIEIDKYTDTEHPDRSSATITSRVMVPSESTGPTMQNIAKIFHDSDSYKKTETYNSTRQSVEHHRRRHESENTHGYTDKKSYMDTKNSPQPHRPIKSEDQEMPPLERYQYSRTPSLTRNTNLPNDGTIGQAHFNTRPRKRNYQPDMLPSDYTVSQESRTVNKEGSNDQGRSGRTQTALRCSRGLLQEPALYDKQNPSMKILMERYRSEAGHASHRAWNDDKNAINRGIETNRNYFGLDASRFHYYPSTSMDVRPYSDTLNIQPYDIKRSKHHSYTDGEKYKYTGNQEFGAGKLAGHGYIHSVSADNINHSVSIFQKLLAQKNDEFRTRAAKMMSDYKQYSSNAGGSRQNLPNNEIDLDEQRNILLNEHSHYNWNRTKNRLEAEDNCDITACSNISHRDKTYEPGQMPSTSTINGIELKERGHSRIKNTQHIVESVGRFERSLSSNISRRDINSEKGESHLTMSRNDKVMMASTIDQEYTKVQENKNDENNKKGTCVDTRTRHDTTLREDVEQLYMNKFQTTPKNEPTTLDFNGIEVTITGYQLIYSNSEDFKNIICNYPQHIQGHLKEMRRKMKNRVSKICSARSASL